MPKDKILVIGASGQIGSELTLYLRGICGSANVIASDIKVPDYEVLEGGPFEIVDVLDIPLLAEQVRKHHVTQIYLLAALLSATAEQNPAFAWRLNVNGLINVLELARERKLKKIFWPSSIAVFGPTTPKQNTPQHTITEPVTVYGITKLTGERLCEYHYNKNNIDVRSLRYPGLISYGASPGGGTTDYAVHIFHEALKHKTYKCFLKKNTTLPMMYMPDAVRATVELMEAIASNVSVRAGYNIAAMSFSPQQLAAEIRKKIKEFAITYKPDARQRLADGWPQSIDDTIANRDWGWKHEFDLEKMTADMFENIK